MYKKKGLVYRVVDEGGKKIGVPIKASAIESRPTLKNLEKRFAANFILRQPYESRVKEMMDAALKHPSITMGEFKQALKDKGIDIPVWQDKQGSSKEITYVDHLNKCVFQGSDLGKAYSTAAIQSRLLNKPKALGSTGTKKEDAKGDGIAAHNHLSNNAITPQEKKMKFPSLKEQVVRGSHKQNQTHPSSLEGKKFEENKIVQQGIAPKQPGIPTSLLQKKRKKNRNIHL